MDVLFPSPDELQPWLLRYSRKTVCQMRRFRFFKALKFSTFWRVFNFLSKSNIKRMNCLPCSQISLQRKQSEYQHPCEVKTYNLGLNKYTEWFKNPHQTRVYLLQILACALQSDISGTEEVKNRSDLWIKKPRNTGLNKTLSKAYRYYLQMAFHMKDGQSFWIHQLEYGFWGCFCNCSTY